MEWIRLLEIQRVAWDDYWNFNDLPENIRQNLHDLRESRKHYFAFHHAKSEMKEYCRAYFVLLSSVLNISPQFQDIRRTLLQKIISFETISARHNESAHQIMLVNNMTNPAYLISRIRYPRVWDDPKYLPLLARADRESGKATMYYHYRQFAPGHGNPLRLLVYMPVDKAKRFEAFHIYHQLQESLVVKKDARCKERAKLIVDCIIHPILKMEKGHKSSPSLFSVADIGGGTGELGKQIFERMFQYEPDQYEGVSWEIIDADFTNFKRHLHNPKMYPFTGQNCL